MEGLREQLIERGWGQGVILDPDAIAPKHNDVVGYLVLTQTCDCINSSFDKEPHLELLPLKEVTGNPDKSIANGRNPRMIQFQIHRGGQNYWVEATISEIITVPRSAHESYHFSALLEIGSSLDAIIAWRVARYARTAFPETFVGSFRAISSKFGKRIERLIKSKEDDQFIRSLLLSLEPFDDLEEGDVYEFQLLLVVHPNVLGAEGNAQELKLLAEDLTKILEKVERFYEPECRVISMKDMTLLQREAYLDFTHYDYLSFGEEDEFLT